MRSFWKVFAALALVLPLGAFVAGNLLASASDDPSPRDTIIIDEQSATPSGDPTPTSSATGTPDATPTSDQGGGDSGHGGGGHSEGIPEATQTPDDWDDDNSGHGGDDSGHGGDDSGPGGGSDDSSGHGGGDD